MFGIFQPRAFIKKLEESRIGEYADHHKFSEIDNLCVNLNLDLHENELHNDGANAVTVLSQFLNLLRMI